MEKDFNIGNFCSNYCIYYDKVFGNVKDVDDATDILVNEYCVDCPLHKQYA